MTRPSLALLWADAWIDVHEARRLAGTRCLISDNRADFTRADAVIFPTPILGDWLPPERSFPEQLWVQWSQESAVHYPQLLDDEFNSRFDLRMTYRLDSDVPIPYVAPDMFDALAPLTPLDRRNPVMVSAWTSSRWDRCGRDPYLLGLMNVLAVHSYGAIGHNCDLVDDTGPASKLAAISLYRFTLALENSMAPDYVTEKFFQPLMVGSVPIYRGAPNVAQFAPAPHSYIDATDFSGPAALAEFLSEMTDAEYLSYHSWRRHGPTDEWRARFAPFAAHAFVRLARVVPTVAIGRRAAATIDRVAPPPRSGRQSSRPPTG